MLIETEIGFGHSCSLNSIWKEYMEHEHCHPHVYAIALALLTSALPNVNNSCSALLRVWLCLLVRIATWNSELKIYAIFCFVFVLLFCFYRFKTLPIKIE